MLKLAKNSSFVIFIALLKCIEDIKILSKCSVESKALAAVSQSVSLFIPSAGLALPGVPKLQKIFGPNFIGIFKERHQLQSIQGLKYRFDIFNNLLSNIQY